MNSTILLILILINTNTLLSNLQSDLTIDSLLKELPNMKEDTNGVNLLKEISFEYRNLDPNEGIIFGKQGVKLSNSINWEIGKANCYNALGTNYYIKSDYSNAIKYYEKSLKINEKSNIKAAIASNLLNLGNVYSSISDYTKSLEYYQKSLKINKILKNQLGIANNLSNIGIIYRYQSDYSKALDYYQEALKINISINNKSGIASNFLSIGILYLVQKNNHQAIEYYHKALKIYIELGEKSNVANMFGNIGIIYSELKDYSKSLEFAEKSLNIYIELGNQSGIARNLGNIGYDYYLMTEYPKAVEFIERALVIFDKIGDKSSYATNIGNLGEIYLTVSKNSLNDKKLLNESLNKSIEYFKKGISIFNELGEVWEKSNILKNLATAYKLKSNYKDAYNTHIEYKELQDSIFSIDKQKEITTLQTKIENKLKDAEIELLKKEKENEKLQRYAMFGGIAGLGIIIGLILIQRRKSEKLLLNILPSTIAKRLKKKEMNIADDFESATIIFIDLVGFTYFAKDKKASEVVRLLNKIFHRFDSLVKKYGLEKIKTMGDGYLAVSGVPEKDKEHCQKAIYFALEIRKELDKFNKEMSLNINARIGLETGPLVAGVIGSSKFIYDIWGDSVNTASRMESTGLPGKVQITENIKNELEKQSLNFIFEKREAFEVKGKGLMQTYYIEENNLGEL